MSFCGWAYNACKSSSVLPAGRGASSRWSVSSLAVVLPVLRGRRRSSTAASAPFSAGRGGCPAAGFQREPFLADRMCSISENTAYGQTSMSSSAALKSASSRCWSSAFRDVGRWTSPVADVKWTEKMTSWMFDVDALLLYERLQYSAIDSAPPRFGRCLLHHIPPQYRLLAISRVQTYTWNSLNFQSTTLIAFPPPRRNSFGRPFYVSKVKVNSV